MATAESRRRSVPADKLVEPPLPPPVARCALEVLEGRMSGVALEPSCVVEVVSMPGERPVGTAVVK